MTQGKEIAYLRELLSFQSFFIVCKHVYLRGSVVCVRRRISLPLS